MKTQEQMEDSARATWLRNKTFNFQKNFRLADSQTLNKLVQHLLSDNHFEGHIHRPNFWQRKEGRRPPPHTGSAP